MNKKMHLHQRKSAYSIVVPLEPAENCPLMNMPVGKLTFPLKAS